MITSKFCEGMADWPAVIAGTGTDLGAGVAYSSAA